MTPEMTVIVASLEVPIIYEPGSNADSYYAVPQKPIRWREHPMELVSKPSDAAPICFKPIVSGPAKCTSLS
jgi:hypothetical protein